MAPEEFPGWLRLKCSPPNSWVTTPGAALEDLSAALLDDHRMIFQLRRIRGETVKAGMLRSKIRYQNTYILNLHSYHIVFDFREKLRKKIRKRACFLGLLRTTME